MRLLSWFRWQQEALIVNVSIKPAAKVTQVLGVHDQHLKIALKAPPIEGKANEALIAFLAELFGTPKSAVTILKGLTNKKKQVKICRPKNREVLNEGGTGDTK